MSNRVFFLAAILILFAGQIFAQQGCGPTDIAVDVIHPNGAPIQGLAAADFSVEAKKQSLSLQSVTYDSGPRRILLIVDATRDLSDEGRKAEVEFASALIAAAQPSDSLALLTARGAVREVKFGSDRSALLPAVKEALSESDRGKLGVLDAVAEGITWFGEPKLGDTIVLVAEDLEGNHKTNYGNVAKTLEEHRIRLFGVAFGHLILVNLTRESQGTYREGLGYVTPGMPLSAQTGDANFLPLTVNSGGYVIPEETADKLHPFKLTDSKKDDLQKTAAAMAALIDRVYALHLQSAPGGSAPWTVRLSQSKVHDLAGARVLYPHQLNACTR